MVKPPIGVAKAHGRVRQLTFEEVNPRAEALVESIRKVGYTLPHAVADLIDNSITAGATRVDVDAGWNGPASWLRVADDGLGMDADRLTEAMRLGSLSPLADRSAEDLGRFGLGLKTASFSQARRLTVQSRVYSGVENTRCWDLDVVREVQKWALIVGQGEGTDPQLIRNGPGRSAGTVILWEKLDQIIGTEPAENQAAARRFWARIDSMSRHLGIVFHRFLSGKKALRIFVNDSQVKPWDPFLLGHPVTQPLPEEVFGSGNREVRVQPFILPHQSKLSNQQHDDAGGEKGWNSQQGFYIYRNRRLLVAGDWLGLYRQEEHYKLARIQIDFQSSADADWKIDVRKAQAVPPDGVMDFLKRIADATRVRAAEAYRHRGHVLARDGPLAQSFLWQQVQRHTKVHYRLNREYPLLRAALEKELIPPADLEALLVLIEETTPVQLIMAQFSANSERQGVPFEDIPLALQRSLETTARVLQESTGLPPAEIRKLLLSMEPYREHPDVVMTLKLEG